VITPVGILAVNVSAFVMTHLAEFRMGIAALALLSGLVLNGLTAWWLLRLASRSAAPLFAEYRRWAIGAAVLIVAVTATGAALVLGGASLVLGVQPKLGVAAIAGFLAGVKGRAAARSGWDPAGSVAAAVVATGRRLKHLVGL